MFCLPKPMAFIFRGIKSAREKEIHAGSFSLISLRFAACGLLGALTGGALIMMGGVAGSAVLFALSGFLEGPGPRAGRFPALGVGVVFLFGGFSWGFSWCPCRA